MEYTIWEAIVSIVCVIALIGFIWYKRRQIAASRKWKRNRIIGIREKDYSGIKIMNPKECDYCNNKKARIAQ